MKIGVVRDEKTARESKGSKRRSPAFASVNLSVMNLDQILF
ncbi:MAG: hypothetical protein SBU_001241 [Candidatus Syntrophoarchaeum butanivorans]|uniref:Uncharacterized protein n=1 Tax=Candidatus Syntropharchaeum butanivorans TaxID=1839936 RepID=A0A1F2P4B5_9EURY|nr:MAG: hypothetical protein SBU_001241 [Candidatus Syntrophoarchaeum butanivorans]